MNVCNIIQQNADQIRQAMELGIGTIVSEQLVKGKKDAFTNFYEIKEISNGIVTLAQLEIIKGQAISEFSNEVTPGTAVVETITREIKTSFCNFIPGMKIWNGEIMIETHYA